MEISDSQNGGVIWDVKLCHRANSSSLFEPSYCLHFQGQAAQKRLFHCEDGDSTILQNISDYLPQRHSITPRPQFDTDYYVDLTGQTMTQRVVSLLP